MRRRGPPLFLAKAGYRLRRLHDAARLVPVFGLFLILLPILWAPGNTAGPDTAVDGLYLFAVWAGLIAVAALLAGRLQNTSLKDADAKTADDPDRDAEGRV